jgi:hypothetical protein
VSAPLRGFAEAAMENTTRRKVKRRSHALRQSQGSSLDAPRAKILTAPALVSKRNPSGKDEDKFGGWINWRVKLDGPFSTVSTPIITTKHSLEKTRRDLQHT